jgi:2-keto-4-pentenoate hydratase/2-oxohepta-3-ene-1,7-dioic acid hydratase in catechol pathway
MKFCYFEYKNEKNWGLVKDNLVFPVHEAELFSTVESDIRLTNSIDRDDVKFLAPVNPSKIICVGRNYAEHAAELGNEVPKEPLLFLKATSSIITESEQIVIPEQSSQVEHEGELGVVIGRACKNLSQNENPLDYVFGYICLNDVTARDLQRRDVQFTRAKSFDTFCPLGAVIETDLDVSDIRITTKVNNVVKQDGRTSQMVFPVSFLLSYISKQMTLNAGDIIATGTPSGVSKLAPGDVCQVEIEGIGVLRNTVI